MSFSVRLSIAMVSLVVLTVIVVGALIHHDTRRAVLPLAKREMQTHTGLLASDLEHYVDGARDDALALSRMSIVRTLARMHIKGENASGGWPASRWRQELSDQFAALIRSKPNYLQLRLIAANAEGEEIVRVNQVIGSEMVDIVSGSDLQSKSGRPYFADTLTLSEGAVYVSQIDYNRERGALEEPYVPTLRIGTPAHFGGDAVGLVMINLDMRPILQRLRKSGQPDGTIYLVDADGNYLLHPDRSKEFGFELGKHFLLQDDWPALDGAVIAAEPQTVEFEGSDRAQVASVWPVALAGESRVAVVEIVPETTLMSQTQIIAGSSFRAGLAAVLLAALVAVGLGISLARPLQQITRGMEKATRDEPVSLPTGAGGEIGVLARTFRRYLERESLLGAIVRSSGDAIFTKRLDGTITSWNSAAERLFGYTEKEAIGSNVRILVPPERWEELDAIMRQAEAGHGSRELQTNKIRKDGTVRDVILTVTPLRDVEGNIAGATAIVRDITERLANERRLQHLQAEAAHASRINAAGQMAGALAHELGQPLTAIINYVKTTKRILVQRETDPEDVLFQYIDKAADQSERAATIVRRLRKFIGNRSSQVDMQNINKVIEEGVETVLVGLDETNIQVNRRYAEGLPEVSIDRIQIQQVVVNLVRNAIEAMETSRTQTLTVATLAIANGIEISVGDTGPGLSSDVRSHLFEPFATTKRYGMGIGLSISHTIIEAHAGTLMAESHEGGTVFRFTLPSEPAHNHA